MTTYVALLRGIGPGNPNMRNEKLRQAFETLGFSDVSSVISSGNIIFASNATDIARLESKIEKVLSEQLGLSNAVIIRTREQLQKIVASNSFAELQHSGKTYLTVTFFKHTFSKNLKVPPNATSSIIEINPNLGVIGAVTDTTSSKTPDFMAWLEKQFGKDITTRTLKTVERILNRMTR